MKTTILGLMLGGALYLFALLMYKITLDMYTYLEFEKDPVDGKYKWKRKRIWHPQSKNL